MRLYLAGPLFTQAERAWNKVFAEALANAGHHVFLPQEEIHALGGLDADTIFQIDVDGRRGRLHDRPRPSPRRPGRRAGDRTRLTPARAAPPRAPGGLKADRA